MKQLLTLVLKLYHCVVAFLCSVCVLSDFGRDESVVSMGHLFPQSVLAAIAFKGSGTRSGRAWPRVSHKLGLLFCSMAATACYSQVARALVLRYRSKLILYLPSVCLLLPSSEPSALVGFNGRERGAGCCTDSQLARQRSRLLLTSHICECQQWLSMPSLDELQDLSLLFSLPRLSVPFGNNKFHPHGKLHWSKRGGVGTWCGWGCVLGCSQETSQSFRQLLPASSALITEWACVCKWLTSESRILRALLVFNPPKGTCLPGAGFQGWDARLEIWTPHSPRVISEPKSSHSSSFLLPTGTGPNLIASSPFLSGYMGIFLYRFGCGWVILLVSSLTAVRTAPHIDAFLVVSTG